LNGFLGLDPDTAYFLLVLCVAFISSIVGAVSGFGGGLIVTPFVAPLFGIKGVVPVMTLALLLGNAGRIWVYRRDVDWARIARIALFVMPGVVIGTFIYNAIPVRVAAFVIGAFLIASIPLRWALKGRAFAASPGTVSAIGFAFGVMTGSTPGAGVVMVSLLLSLGLSGPALVGTDAVIGLTVAIVKTAMFGSFSLVDAKVIATGLAIGGIMLPGAYAGRWLVTNLSMAMHVRMIEAVVCLAGGWFIWKGLVPDAS
jgi:hypothetical protein